MDKRTQKKLEVICQECDAIWKNELILIGTRAKALRLYIDIYEDIFSLEQRQAKPRFLKEVLREYDSELMEIYEAI